MPSTAIGLSFDLHDLSANYEVVGTSDNYSFQYQLGKGKDLVTGEHEEYDLIAFGQNEFTGEKIQTIVPLKGNYGDFNIRVFAVSDIGTRSEFVQEQIYISPPTFDGTFTFANLKIDDLPDGANLNNLIIDSPDNVGDTLEVESEYVNKNISLSWDLIPPEGHSLGGQAVNEELNSDAFFDHFEIKIKNTKDNILIDDATLNNSVSLQDSLSTANVAGKLSSYKSFNLQISEAAFSDQELNLDRHVFFEISAFDSKGGSCTGTLSGINFLPDLSLSQRTSSSDSSFFFSSEDSDFKSVEVNYIGIPANESLNDIYNLQNNIDFFKNIKDARQYVSLKDEQFYQDQSMVVFEGDVYVAQQDHLNSNSTSPPNSSYWLNIGPKVEYVSESLRITEESFVNKQIFGYSYYYTFRPSDGYGTGQLFNFTEDGLVEASNFAELSPITSEIKIENLNFREREDDLIFEWNFVDQDGLPVELANEKYQINFGDEPKVLGLSGHLFDNHTNRYLSGIGEEKLNSEFTYSRELNNSIYKDGGFPEGVENFNSSEIYTPDDNDKVIDKTDIFDQSQYFTDGASEFFSTLPVEKEFVYNSIKQNAAKQPYVRPFYEYWDPAKTYYYRSSLPFSDVVKYNGVLYESLSDSGPESSEEIGVFNENTVYNLNDLVVAPSRMIEIFNSTKSYLSTDVVLYEGAIYEALTNQSVGNAVEPDLDSSFWKIIRPFYDIDCFIYKYVASSSASTLAPTRDDTQSWQLQTPDVSDKFKICIDSYSNTPNADYVFFNETVYKANNNSTTSEPPIPLTTLNQDYTTLDWTPFWEINDDLEDVVFGHIGIPESGKRSVGLEVGVVSSDGQVVSRERIIGDNPAPVISSDGFSIDSQSEVTKVKFNFNYLLGRQEKTTLLNLYRSDQPDFEITGSDGLPFTEINQTDSTFVKSVVGEGDATFGDNITQIVDDTAEVGEEITGYYYKLLPFDDFGSGALYTAVNNEDPIEKVWVLPKNFHSKNPDAPTGPAIKITTDEIPGPVKSLEGETAFENYFLNWNMPNAQIQNNLLVDAAPNDISYYEVWQSAGQPNNFLQFSDGSFLTEEQNATGYRRIDGIQYTFGDNIPTEYEDFASGIVNATNVLDIDASSPSIQITHRGQVNDTSYFWVRPVDHAGNKGPFTGASDLANTDNVEGLKLILGQAKTTDIADFEQNISQSFPNTISLVPNNPFSYDNNDLNTITDDVVNWDDHVVYHDGEGYLVKAGSLNIGATPYNGTAYIYWSSTETTAPGGKEETQDLESNPQVLFSQDVLDRLAALGIKTGGEGELDKSVLGLRNVKHAGQYEFSHYHPAGLGDGGDPDEQNQTPKLLKDDGDFIIARVAGGAVSPMWHSFANAVIGSAHIEDAAITNAKIHNLTADKIRSAVIQGQDIQIGDNPPGQIRSQGFEGLDDTGQGFVVSGDGSFVFAADDGRLFFDNSELVLEGKLRQIDGKEYTFVDLDASPDSFFYNELSDGTFTPDDTNDVCSIRASFQNSFIQANQVRFRVSNPNNGYEFIKYSDTGSNGGYNISGFKYDPSDFVNGEPKVATAEFKVDSGFNQMINTVDPQLTTIIVSASGLNTSTERSIPINFVADGAAAVYAELKAQQQVYSYDYDGKFNDTNLNLNLEATAHNTHGNIEFLFETGVNLEASSLEEIRRVTKDTNTTNTDSFELANFADNALQYYNNTPFVAKLTISDKDENNNSRELASDFVSIFGTLPGKDSYTVFLTNENHTYPAQENGSVTSSQDYVLGQTKVKFFRGNTEYTHDKDGSNTNVGTYRIDSNLEVSPATVSASIVDDTVDDPIIEITGLPKNVDEGTITINIYDNQYYGTTEQEVFSKVYTFSKTKEGAKGRQLELTAPDQTIEYNSQGSLIGPNSVTITANTENFFDANPQFEFYSGDFTNTIQDQGVGNTYTHDDIPGSYDSDHIPVTILCKAFDSLDGTTFEEKARDQITIFGIKEGANAITFVQSQEFANVPVANSSSGDVDTPDFSSTTNEIKVFEGIKELTYGGTSDGTTKGNFYITDVSVKDASNDSGINSVTKTGPTPAPSTPSTTINGWTDLTITNVYLEYSIKVVNHEGLAETFSIRQNVTLTFDGTIARKVDLTADDQTIEYDSAGNTDSGQEITLTATAHNTIGDVYYKYTAIDSNGAVVDNPNPLDISGFNKDGTEVKYTVPQVIGGPVKIKVEISEKSDGSVVLATDEITIYSLKNGSDVITAILSNEAHSLTKNFNNIIDYSGSGTTIQVYQGTTELDVVDDSATLSAEKYKISTAATNIQANRSTTTLNEFDNASNLTAATDTASITFTIVGKDSDGKDFSIVKAQTFSMSQEGEHARKVDLTGDQAVKYNTAGSSPDPDEITLTATALNQRSSSTLQYKYSFVGNTIGALKESNSAYNGGFIDEATIKYNPPDNKFKVATIMVEMREDGIDVAKDTLSIYGIQDGSDVITAILSNEAHSLTKNFQGTISSTGSGTDIKVFQGAEELKFVTGTGAPSTNNTFTVTAPTISGITGGSRSKPSNEKYCNVDDYNFSAFTGQSATITYTITFKNDVGEEGIITKQQTFSISEQGIQGNRGVGITFRGVYDPTEEEYIGAVDGGNRGDVVEYNGSYYLCIQDNGAKSTLQQRDPTDGAYWEGFGAEFSSVATDILLAKNAAITRSLVMGKNTKDPSGSGGVIRSANKTEFGDGNKGFFLGDTDVVEFEVGDSDSFIKFDTDSDRVEIKGSLIINSRDYTDLDINSTAGEDATFIGGGYNNFITGSQAGQDGLASSIVGGGENDVSGRFSFIGGGFDNNLGDNFSAIVAGYNNEMPNLETGNAGANFIGAGVLNVIDGGSSQSVCNGKFNEIVYSPELYLGEMVTEDQANVVFNDNIDLLGEKYLAFDPEDGVYPMEDFIIGDLSLSYAAPSVKLITLAYRSLLYREPDSTGINHYLGYSDMGSVISNIKTSSEYSTRQNNLPAPKLQMILADSIDFEAYVDDHGDLTAAFANSTTSKRRFGEDHYYDLGISEPRTITRRKFASIIGSRIAEKFHVPRDFLSGTRSDTFGKLNSGESGFTILENPFYTKESDLTCYFSSNSKYYDSSSEFGYWVLVVEPVAISGWVYISPSYSSEGIWVYLENGGWIFIWNSETLNLSYGAYQRLDDGVNYKLDDGSVIP